MDTSEAKDAITLEFSSDDAAAGRSASTVLKLNGQDITRFCTLVQVTSSVRDVSSAHIELLLRAGFRLQLPVSAQLLVTVLPGCRLIEEQTETGKQWTAEQVMPYGRADQDPTE